MKSLLFTSLDAEKCEKGRFYFEIRKEMFFRVKLRGSSPIYFAVLFSGSSLDGGNGAVKIDVLDYCSSCDKERQ